MLKEAKLYKVLRLDTSNILTRFARLQSFQKLIHIFSVFQDTFSHGVSPLFQPFFLYIRRYYIIILLLFDIKSKSYM